MLYPNPNRTSEIHNERRRRVKSVKSDKEMIKLLKKNQGNRWDELKKLKDYYDLIHPVSTSISKTNSRLHTSGLLNTKESPFIKSCNALSTDKLAKHISAQGKDESRSGHTKQQSEEKQNVHRQKIPPVFSNEQGKDELPDRISLLRTNFEGSENLKNAFVNDSHEFDKLKQLEYDAKTVIHTQLTEDLSVSKEKSTQKTSSKQSLSQENLIKRNRIQQKSYTRQSLHKNREQNIENKEGSWIGSRRISPTRENTLWNERSLLNKYSKRITKSLSPSFLLKPIGKSVMTVHLIGASAHHNSKQTILSLIFTISETYYSAKHAKWKAKGSIEYRSTIPNRYDVISIQHTRNSTIDNLKLVVKNIGGKIDIIYKILFSLLCVQIYVIIQLQ